MYEVVYATFTRYRRIDYYAYPEALVITHSQTHIFCYLFFFLDHATNTITSNDQVRSAEKFIFFKFERFFFLFALVERCTSKK